jgi:hypothetical protein
MVDELKNHEEIERRTAEHKAALARFTEERNAKLSQALEKQRADSELFWKEYNERPEVKAWNEYNTKHRWDGAPMGETYYPGAVCIDSHGNRWRGGNP